MSTPGAQKPTLVDDAWDSVVGGFDWIKSVLIGEFADNRPLSAVIADMLVSFVPGVVIVTSARDAVAVSLRLAQHPEKRQHVMEWVVLCACLITLALPLAMAAGGLAAAGVGAIVGGIAGSELGAALRAVMLLLAREGAKLVELIQFLQKFVSGNIIGFLKAVKFIQYEKVLIQALSKITGKLLTICKSVRIHLEKLLAAAENSSVARWVGEHTDLLKNSSVVAETRAAIAKLAEWERRFYALQQDAIKQVPLALAELDARLTKVLSQAAPKEVHTVASGTQADKAVATLPPKQAVTDVAGRSIPVNATPSTTPRASRASPTSRPPRSSKPAAKPPADPPKPPPKDKPDPVASVADGKNTKKQATLDVAAAADKERISGLSKEAAEAEARGDKALAAAKTEEARTILRPHLPKNPGDSWDEVIKRLDVSSPKDGAVFWSGDPKLAQRFAESINGVTLETTTGGRIIDGWDEVNKAYAWDPRFGDPPYGRDLWAGVSENYAKGVSGQVNAVQPPPKLWDEGTLWHNVEKPVIQNKLMTGEVTGINLNTVNSAGDFIPLSDNYVDSLMKLEGRVPW